jgi:S-layer protein (TIGR01567 family)
MAPIKKIIIEDDALERIRSLIDEPRELRRYLDLIQKRQKPVIDKFQPRRAYPGSIIEIFGNNFSSDKKNNDVTIGARKATVIEANLTKLKAITSPYTKTGPVKIDVRGRKAVGPFDFETIGSTDSQDDGPPILYEGTGSGIEPGAPTKGILKILIVLCHARDHVPSNKASTRDAIVSTYNNVHDYYDQISYGQLDVQVKVTDNWRELDGNIADFMDGDNLKNKEDDTKLPQIIAEAADQAISEGEKLDDYQIIGAMVFTNVPIRCWGGGGTNIFNYENPNHKPDPIKINWQTTNTISTMFIDQNADWGRCAHEAGHCLIDLPPKLNAWDIEINKAGVLHEDLYTDPKDIINPKAANAESFDLMGDHDTHPLFSGYYMEQLKYYDGINIKDLSWDRNPFSQTFEIVAHGQTQNASSNRYHLVKIKVSEGLYYYIEVRQRPDSSATPPILFDEQIPLNGAAHQGGVIVTMALTGVVNNNQQMRFITLLHDPQVLKKGEIASDPARYLNITVEDDHVTERPLVCRVKVEWAQNIADTEGTDFDLWIEPWNGNFETPDIWIDRPPYGTYDHTDPNTNKPIGNGDRPRPRDSNRFYGRVHCDGADAKNVVLRFYSITPPGVGDNGNWTPLPDRITFSNIPKGKSKEDYIIWVPEVGEHTCLKIFAERQAGERYAGGNNWAQENVFDFDAPASSVPEPLCIPVAVRNPREENVIASISVRNVPEGFIAHFPHSWLFLKPLQERKMTLTVIPTRDYSFYAKSPRAVRFQFEAWGTYDVVNAMADKYLVGYNSGTKFTKEASAINNGKLKKVLIDNAKETTITSAEPLVLAEGYQLYIKSIDTDGNKAYLELNKDGRIVDSKIIQPSIADAKMSDKTYFYKVNLGASRKIVQIAVHFKNAFRGAELPIATIDGIFQVSDKEEPIEVGQTNNYKADVIVEGWIPRSYKDPLPSGNYPASCFSPMGGILSQVTPKRKVELIINRVGKLSLDGMIEVYGSIDPAINLEKITVEMEDPAGRRRISEAITDSSGSYNASFDLMKTPSLEAKPSIQKEEIIPGDYIIQAFIINSPFAAQAESNVVHKNISIIPP